MDDDDLLWDLDNIPSGDDNIDSQLCLDYDKSPLPDGIDERNVERILSLVRKQYASLQEENSKLLQLIDMVKKKIEQCVKKEGCFGVASSGDQFGHFPMNLEVKKETFYRSEVEEEDDDDEEEIILGGF
ncbi:Hypothetical protein NTJ_14391 [Nesidiocoris tenuis]|uniref:Uncharacterized protein n=1 Tax=Nesidiocoris tenuis TaxID=355587 RepID=A0ABN7BB03_9HEMI|nr:Hypothetical protein NTJ_14391 [Nesidiocoris tenuis]